MARLQVGHTSLRINDTGGALHRSAVLFVLAFVLGHEDSK
jgi:hypothetical protein